MRHRKANYHFNRDRNSRRALFLNLAKSLVEKEQIKTTLQRAKALRPIVEKMVTRAKVDSVANRRSIAKQLENDNLSIKKLFTVLGPRYKDRAGGYTRVLRSGIRYGDAAELAVIEFIDREIPVKKLASEEKEPKIAIDKKDNALKKTSSVKVAKKTESDVKETKDSKKVSAGKRKAKEKK